jgi:hypothetical protein
VWTCVVDLTPDPVTGRRRQRRLSAPTRKALAARVTDALHAVRAGRPWPGDEDELDGGRSPWMTPTAMPPAPAAEAPAVSAARQAAATASRALVSSR